MDPKPTIDFCALISGFARAALIDLGRVAEPCTGVLSRDLAMAEQNIAIIEMLRRKTSGNLSAVEQELLEKLLTDLRQALAAAKEEA
ncbi:MAG: hypothetical protein BWY87_01517 [Deltaproteobacteria bacterium ADurb.Bin510]|nr:MAG: hypothetical protein BWY87_01517 [Deltaproteobacteria bacterium ADurb.Bin510]